MERILGNSFFNTRIKSRSIGKQEMWLGHFAGPLCVILLNTILTNYLNVYYTDVMDISAIWGGAFLVGFPIVVKVMDAFTFVVMGRIVDRTATKQGKARPWILFSAPLLVISTILLFAVPKGNDWVVVIWIFLSYNLFYSIAFTAYNTSHTLMVPLSTRDEQERNKLSLFTNSQGMVAGIFVAILFPCIVIPAIGVNQKSWITLMTGVALISFPFILMEYFYTRERITEEKIENSAELVNSERQISLKVQLLCCLKSRRWIVLMIYMIVLQFVNALSSAATFYYCNWVLGSYNDGITQALFYAVGQAPLGIGILLCTPICKRFGRNNAMAAGFILAAAGTIICLMNPRNLVVVLIGQFVKSMGLIPSAFMVTAFLGDALDDVEVSSGVRCDGFSSSIFNVIATISAGLALCLFNLGLTRLGYIAPGQDGSILVQNGQIVAFFIFAVVGCQTAAYPILAALLKFGKKAK